MIILLVLMALLWRLCAAAQRLMRVWMPSNVTLDWLRTRRGVKWAIPAACVLTPAYLLAAALANVWIKDGGPGWLNLFVLVFIWDAFKFGFMAPWSLVLLGRYRLRERRV